MSEKNENHEQKFVDHHHHHQMGLKHLIFLNHKIDADSQAKICSFHTDIDRHRHRSPKRMVQD